ncbi:RND family efflux transporter MFP subunit [Novosphingobium nitrogenifigens DSM 19370]|uniref:RND family efflux transporter MFP subunit n=1 Tax=Novosphingobium nitrogenifigens DSM 19370 TaxID=983920 RepID=F1ZD22_9SPHN|nr:efflux RND transporter periplasmic adaptor subunit [Novosphingobium nitrogenifigens]EGD57491.1 RND family efflux transporter MFP subunit [Novosphingobium nitrogenifigens DSM 19370]
MSDLHSPVDLDAPLPDGRRLGRLGILLAVGAVGAAALGIALRERSVTTAGEEARTAAVSDVAVVHPMPAAPSDEIVLPGQIQAWNNAAINARTNGYVRTWLADIGDHVHEGQPLAVLDAPEVDQALAQAEADYQTALANQRLAATTAHRWTQLLGQDAVSRQENDEKQGDLAAKSALANSALANVKRLRAMQGFERVYAPFDGVVTSRAAQIGALVVTGNATAQPLFTVADVHRMRVYVRVPQNYSAMIHPGISASLILPEFPGREFNADLTRSANAVDTQSGSVLVELQADNGERLLKPGAFTQVHFHASGSVGTLALPGSAILYGSDGPRVAVVDKSGKVAMRKVMILRDEGNQVRVNGAITASDSVVDTPPDAIHDGQQVRVTQVLHPQDDAKGKPHG